MTLTNKKIEIAHFSRTPRSNMIIEILRLVGLIILINQHFSHIGFIKVPFLQHFSDFTGRQFSVSIFIAITGIFTVGKGKDYFLRNFSRLLFVIVAISAIFLPLFFSIDMNAGATKLSWATTLWGVGTGDIFEQ